MKRENNKWLFIIFILLPGIFFQISCKKFEKVMMVVTGQVSDETATSAKVDGEVIDLGEGTFTSSGICFAKNANPNISDGVSNTGTSSGTYTCTLNGLDAGQGYYARAFLTTSTGTVYGKDIQFTTKAVPRVSSTFPANNATSVPLDAVISATFNQPMDGSTITSSTFFVKRGADELAGTVNYSGTTATFTPAVNLISGATYVATITTGVKNADGIAIPAIVEWTFSTTTLLVPTVTTNAVESITLTDAVSGGSVISDGGASITGKGVCWSTTLNPDISNPRTNEGSGPAAFTSTMTNLSPGTIYYVRAYATNAAGTGYGVQFIFSTDLADKEGNVYHTLNIGSQLWMAENLKSTQFRDNSKIPNVTLARDWEVLTTPGLCYYSNDEAGFNPRYGALYNWYAVSTNMLCPAGWHVPNMNDWNALFVYLTDNGYGYGGSGSDIAKSLSYPLGWDPSLVVGSVGYQEENNNSSGFSAQPGGVRHSTGTFEGINTIADFWSSTSFDVTTAYHYWYYNTDTDVRVNNDKKTVGNSVRCIKD